MRFDYVDIGTSDFDTSLDIKKSKETILLIEPLSCYLRNLPENEGVFKFNAAVSNKNDYASIHFVDPEDITRLALPNWVRGCNSFESRHEAATKALLSRGLSIDLIKKQQVLVVKFQKIVDLYEITEIGRLKIDTEGHDHVILADIIAEGYPLKLDIQEFVIEYNKAFNNTRALDECIKQLVELGYKDIGMINYDVRVIRRE